MRQLLISVVLIVACAAGTAGCAVEGPTAVRAVRAPPAPRHVVAQAKPARAAAPAAEKGAEAVLFEDRGKPYCLGGISCLKRCADPAAGCEVRNVYVVRLDRPAHIARIRLLARETRDETRWADLLVRVEGAKVGKLAAFGRGASREIAVNRTGRVITLEAAPHLTSLHAGAVEAVISDLYVFGRAPR